MKTINEQSVNEIVMEQTPAERSHVESPCVASCNGNGLKAELQRLEEFEGEEVEAWNEAVDGGALLNELDGVLRRFVILPRWAAETLALWVLHTYAFRLREVSTYVGIESPEKRCGKTTLLSVLSELVHRPVVAANISSPAFFRVIQQAQPTLMIDEADTFLQGNDELRGILNSGYTRKTAFVLRVGNDAEKSKFQHPIPTNNSGTSAASRVEPNSKFRRVADERLDKEEGRVSLLTSSPTKVRSGIVKYSCWCPKVVAAIGRLPDTLADRCIVIRMQRKTTQEECERLRGFDGRDFKRKCARFVADNAEKLAKASPEVPESLNDRAADIWEPLLALADIAGGDWPERARQAAEGLTMSAQESNPIASLLLDLFFLFARTPGHKLFTRNIVASLNMWDGRPWKEGRNGRPVTDMWLSQQLRPYGVKPRNIWIEGEQAKGFAMDDLSEVFRRYIPKADVEAFVNEIEEQRSKGDTDCTNSTHGDAT